MKRKLLFFVYLISSGVYADETFWEFGAGVSAFNTALYPGSSEEETYVIPFPYFRVQSEHFEVDEGIRGFLFESPDYRLNISGGIGVPVNSEDSNARSGMPDLNTVLQIGPSFEVIFSGGRKKPHEFRLELPLRTAIATDLSSTDNIGWIFEPRLSYETLRPFKSG
ncbi:MAG: MipA/OmpV family protein, partial [Gammaproteobacteria bacterium]|nr:MipA/OmpV family protein [Gammaproteobacteria bacterium]